MKSQKYLNIEIYYSWYLLCKEIKMSSKILGVSMKKRRIIREQEFLTNQKRFSFGFESVGLKFLKRDPG
jgi:hypothetical protein